MKDESGVCSKLELIEAISRSLKETTVSLSSPLQLSCDSRNRLDGGGALERQEEELEVASVLHLCAASLISSQFNKSETDTALFSLAGNLSCCMLII